MNREEAIKQGIELHDTMHSMKRRTPWHDYRQKGTYMLTLVVDGRQPVFGTIRQKDGVVYVERSALGCAIEHEEVPKIHRYYSMVNVWRLCIMPDHIHMIVRVSQDLPQGKTLGNIVRGFKTGCSRAWWRLCPVPAVLGTSRTSGKAEGTVATSGKAEGTVAGKAEGTVAGTVATSGKTEGTVAGTVATSGKAEGTVAGTVAGTAAGTVAGAVGATVPLASPKVWRPVLFEPGYNDKILLHEGQLDNWKHYLDDNPRRLWMKRQNPQLFTVLHGLDVAGRKCQTVGNLFLLDIPDKVAVIVHRRYTEDDNKRLREEWLACGERGGVLVSAAIAPKEKEVLREAMDRGYRIILLRENGFPELYKPSGESFDKCSAGLLLQISPWEYHMERLVISRAQCLELNSLAEAIVKG